MRRDGLALINQFEQFLLDTFHMNIEEDDFVGPFVVPDEEAHAAQF